MSLHERFVRRGAIRWRVRMGGEGPAALLLHGTGASSHSFRAVGERLVARGMVVVAPDLPGHGGTIADAGFEPSLPGVAAAVAELVEELGVAPRVIVGHSAGAAIGAQMVLDGMLAPRAWVGVAAALRPVAAWMSEAARWMSRSGVAAELLARAARDRRAVAALLRRVGARLGERDVDEYARLARDPEHVAGVLAMLARWDLGPLWAELRRVGERVDVVLVAGERDAAVPVAEQREAAARFGGGARVVVVEGAGHLVHEERAEEVARVVEEVAG